MSRSSQFNLPDAEAFEALFHRYKNLVYRLAFLILEDREEAEDALQEVFLQVYRALNTYDPSKGAFTTWLHQITVNHCLNRKRKRRFLSVSLDRLVELFSPPQDSAFHKAEEEEELQQALAQLNERLRMVLILRYFSELSYEEISQILQIPVGTVKSRLARALKALQHKIRQESSRAIEKGVTE
ncbi:MAG: RNA polymerase sigma factor [Anaerolineales bacterium]|nr:RNA polymerase sigma factor [Anaerolineales bacterium]MDW8162595.1 RNA polymerase sigma factor [Anaerolineales bacterium]